MIYIGSDHGGFQLKVTVKRYLVGMNFVVQDFGPEQQNDYDDYVDYAAPVAQQVSSDPVDSRGILICRSGQGMNIVANKFKGVRAALVWNVKEAVASRTDDLTNVLTLPADYITPEEALQIVQAWLETPAGTEDRHVRRVQKIKDLENNLYK
jgi:ribose 5-phosphate isomerase B